MQSQNSYAFLIAISAGIHIVLFIAMFFVLVTGWRRQRNLGFIVLAAWTGVSATRWCAMPLISPFYTKIASSLGTSPSSVVIMGNFLSGTVMYALLLLGFSLLVFNYRTQRQQEPK